MCDTSKSDNHSECCSDEKPETCRMTEGILNPVCFTEHKIEKLTQAFPHAVQGAMVDFLKEEIKKSWGPVMKKEAEAFVKAMSQQWQAAKQSSTSSHELREELKKIMTECCSK
jgi:hypothetical protein